MRRILTMVAAVLLLFLSACSCPRIGPCVAKDPEHTPLCPIDWATGHSKITITFDKDTKIDRGYLAGSEGSIGSLTTTGQWRMGLEQWGYTVYLYSEGEHGVLKARIINPAGIE